VKALLDELAVIVAAARLRKLRLAVIGACALRTYLSSPDRRTSVDADVLITTDGLASLEALLVERGYRVYDLGAWHRAERNADRLVIDIAVDRIVDVRSFQPYMIAWEAVTERASLPVPRIEDLLAQKLVSAREKDLLDVLLVASDASIPVSANGFGEAVESNDVEVPVARGLLEAQAAVQSGRMAQLWTERFGEAPGRALDIALERLMLWKEKL
jgi:hypothetical protein